MDTKALPVIANQTINPAGQLTETQKATGAVRRANPDHIVHEIVRWWKGEAHTHSQESTRQDFGYVEGFYDLEEILAYFEKLGLQFVCFTEHASKPGQPRPQTRESPVSQSLLKEAQRITRLNQDHHAQIMALSGVEANILFHAGQPMLDVPDAVLEKLDLVIASRHAIEREKEPQAIKQSLLYAIHHPAVDVIGHPDRYTRRDGWQPEDYWRDYWRIWPEILRAMYDEQKAFEINLNSQPAVALVERAVAAGVKLFINHDAHDFPQYEESWKKLLPLYQDGEAVKRKWAQGSITAAELEVLRQYKTQRLTEGPGLRSPLRLLHWIHRLKMQGVTPDRVVNSSAESLLHFLTLERGKTTDNLLYLITGHQQKQHT